MSDVVDAVPDEALPNTEAEIFESALADAPATEPETVKSGTEAEGNNKPPRDEKGQFTAKDEKTDAKSEPVAKADVKAELHDDDKGGHVPSWRVREINAEKAELAKKLEAEQAERSRLATQFEAMQREMQSLRKPVEQPKKELPDPLIDPDGYRQQIRAEIQESILNERRETSLAMAHRTYKQDFEEAYTSAQQAMAKGDVALAAKMQQSRDPGETLMTWHREQKTMREVGNDPNAFFEKRLESYLSDPANIAKVMERAKGVAQQNNGANQRPNVQLPPSLSNMSRGEGSRGGEDENDLSDEGLFRHAIR